MTARTQPEAGDAPDSAGSSGHGAARAVLFDLDGTLVNTAPDIAAAINRMLAAVGRSPYPVERILEWVGEGAPRLVQRALVGGIEGEPPADELKRGLAMFFEHYATGICVHSVPYPHVRWMLEVLRASGSRIGCVTNKPERLARLLLEKLELAPMFDVVVGGDTLEYKKPCPEPIQYACRQLGLLPGDAVYVGDSMTDCRAAAAAGIPMVAVTWGYNGGMDLTAMPCAAMIDSFETLPDALNRI
jgi:phosphoglycolate phosphatase